jgi:hypothetical protein
MIAKKRKLRATIPLNNFIILLMLLLMFFSGIFIGVSAQTHAINKDMREKGIVYCSATKQSGGFTSLPPLSNFSIEKHIK